MEVHHIGYLVRDLKSAIEEFQTLRYSTEVLGEEVQEGGSTYDYIRKVNIAFMKNGSYRIELVEPLEKDSPIYGLLKSYSNCPYYICYCSKDLRKDIEKLKNNGWTLFQEPEIASALFNRQVAFLMSASIGMIELVAEK